MGRPKEFDKGNVLDAAIGVFREHGYSGTSTSMLVGALGIGRQSLYDTFGGKWDLYLEAVRKYSLNEIHEHFIELRSASSAFDGIKAMIARVVSRAIQPCLGVNSICEFGIGNAQLAEVHRAAGRMLGIEIVDRVRQGQQDGDISTEIDAVHATEFLVASIATIRLAARGGADRKSLASLGALALRALR